MDEDVFAPSCEMKPNPLLSLNHFTVPCAMKTFSLLRTDRPPCGFGTRNAPATEQIGSRTFV